MEPKMGDKIRQRRKEMGFTLKELAGDRITPAQISAIENNKCNPSSSLLEYLCEKLEVNIEYFTFSNEQKQRYKFNEIKKLCMQLIEEGNLQKARAEMETTRDMFGKLDEEQKGYYYYVLGRAAYEAEKFNEAFDLFVKGVAHCLKTKDNDMIADMYIKVGNSLFYMGNPDLALGYYMNAYNFIEKLEDKEIALKLLFNMAVCYSELDRPKQCKEFVDKSIAYLEEHDIKKKDSYTPGLEMLKGILLMHDEENSVSIQNFKDAFEKYKNENDTIGMGRALYNLGMTSWEAGMHEDAVNYLAESVQVKELAGERNVVDSYVSLMKLYCELKKFPEAAKTIAKAEEKMISMDYKEGLSEVFIAKFELLCEQGDYDRAEIFGYLAIDTIQKSGLKKLESSMYIKLSEMYKKMGDDKSAVENLMKANTVSMSGAFEKLRNGTR